MSFARSLQLAVLVLALLVIYAMVLHIREFHLTAASHLEHYYKGWHAQLEGSIGVASQSLNDI